ncbi:hypothetical protein HY745_11075 [Candidatus Desantisbacteria bacterium]|nr:hypothetical protein [Candidatus Desantisbacteria bacterium]
MLNELRELSQSLINAGIQLTDWHPNFEKCPNATTCFIYLDKTDGINDIALPEPDFDVRSIRKWEKSNGCSFPAFNVPPLFKMQDDEGNKSIKEKNDILIKEINQIKKYLKKGNPVESAKINELINNFVINWDDTIISKINLCLSRAITEIEEKLGKIPSEYLSIQELLERAKKVNVKIFHQNLKEKILQKLMVNMNSDFMDMLFQTAKTAKFQLVFEINYWGEIKASYPANHPTVQRWMNDRFMNFTDQGRIAGEINKDAFNDNDIGWEEKFPSVRMSVLGNVILRAMSSESQCQKRYGMIDAASFPIGANARKEMKGALEWLSDDARKTKTWIDLTKNIDNSSILFAYPAKMPDAVPELAGLMGGGEEDAIDPDGVTFSAIASRVTQTLKGIASGFTNNEVRIFVLVKRPGDARTKVIVNKRYTTEHTVKSAENWQIGCLNIPNIKIRQFENGTPMWKPCLVPFPAEVVWCLNTAWRRQGSYAERIHGFSINDALCLLLDEGDVVKMFSIRAIDTIIKNCSQLLLSIGQEAASGRVFKINKNYEKQALLLPSILGLLLYKINIEKGEYMNSPTYLIGRFLSISDDLHLKYCQHVRKGSIPPQLVGNALMSTALEEPEKALSMLSQRILPYQSWAKTFFGENQDVGLVKYFLSQIGDITNQLRELTIPIRCSDADKAQMLLGYMAKSESN